MNLDKERIIRSIRLAIALIICFGITHVFHISHPLWIFITLVVVLFDQSTVGGAIFRGYLRVGATLLGAASGIIVLIVFHNNQLVIQIIIVLGIIFYAYLFMDTKYSYIGLLGSITMLIVLVSDNNLTPKLSMAPNLDVSLTRVTAIIIGTIIAVFSMILFFPEYAKYKIKQHIAKSLNKIEYTIQIFINPINCSEEIQQQLLIFENKLITEIAKFIRLNDEMHYETKIKIDYTQILLYLRRLYRLLNIVFDNLLNPHIRHNKVIHTTLRNLAKEFKCLEQQMLYKDKTNHSHIVLDTIEFPLTEIKSITDYELIFVSSILNRILNETKLLSIELGKTLS